MLSTMRKGVSSIFSKILLLLLVLSFGLWGIGDMLRNSGSTSVARVGSARISPQEFNERLARIKAQMQNLPADMIDSPMMRTQVLQGMVQQLLLLQEAEKLGVKADDKTIARIIRNNPEFQNGKGQFNENAFLLFLNNNRVSETGYIQSLRQDIEAATVLQTIDLPASLHFATLSNTLDAAKRQARTADVYIIPPVTTPVTAPSDETLKGFYASIEHDYMQPEERSIGYVTIETAALDKHLAGGITEEAVKDRYAAEKDSLGTPEKRDVLQYLLKDEATAKDVAQALRKGENVGKLGAKVTEMKAVAQSSLPKTASEKVFTLKTGTISDPFETSFGWHVFKIERIIPADVPSLEKAHDRIREMLVIEAREDVLNDLTAKFEDAIAAGDSLEKAAKQLDIPASTAAVTTTNKDVPEGDAKNSREYALKTGFGLSEGEVSGFQPADKEYIAVITQSITPETPKPLESVKADVLKRYNESERVRLSAERASRVTTLLTGSTDPQALVTKEKLVRRSFGPVTLGQALSATKDTAGFPPQLLRHLFDVKLGELTPPARLADGSWALAKVVKITQSTAPAASNSAPSGELTATLTNAVYANYLRDLTGRYPVHVNEALLKGTAE